MKLLAIVALSLLLAACPRPPITSESRDAFAEVEALWRSAGHPEPGNCLDGARVLFTDRDDFRDRCGYGHASDVARECLSRYQRGMFGHRDGWLVLIVNGSPTAERDVRHAILHALTACTMERADIFDGNHTDQSVWRLVP